MIVATSNDNPSKIIISFDSLTYANEETDLVTFYNVLIIRVDMNTQIGKNENNKFGLHNTSNRNGEYLSEVSLKNGLTCLDTKLQKRTKKLETYNNANKC